MAKYLRPSKVKNRAHELGFRMSKDFLYGLDIAVDILIERTTQWAKPSKTLRKEDLFNYLYHHKVKV